MPSEQKESMSPNEFRSKIKTWKPENCPCKLFKIYLPRIGYLQVTNYYLHIDTVMVLYLFGSLFCWVFFCLFLFLLLLSFSPCFLNPSLKLTEISLVFLIKALFFVHLYFFWSTINKKIIII